MTELLKISAYAIPLIVAAIILRALFINHLPKKTFLALWAVVLCRLLVPITLPSPVSIYSLVNRLPKPDVVASIEETARDAALPQAQQMTVYQTKPSTQTEPEPTPAQGTVPKTASSAGANSEISRQKRLSQEILTSQTLLTILWVGGLAGCAGFFIVTHLRCRRVYHAALPIDDAFVAEWLRAYPLWRTVHVRKSDQIHAPLTYGVLRPVLLLPKSLDRNDRERLSYILAHEGAHIRHFDVLWKWLLAAAVCFHWFNPLVWAMYVLANRDIELCCDDAVVRSFGETIKSAYALALISLEEKRSRFVPLGNNFSKTAIEERIISIMKFKKNSAVAILLSAMLIAGTTAAFSFGAAESAPQIAAFASQSTSYEATAENVAPDYAKYEPFGITYVTEADRLYYNGRLIRCFDDEYPLGDGATAGIRHYTQDGVVDVSAVRDLSQPVRNADGSYDPSGVLTGVKPYSQTEFDARSLDVSRDAVPGKSYAATAVESTPVSPEEMEKEYSVYEPFGITYDKENDLLYYRGKLIHRFLDVLSSNGEDFSGGKFQGSMRSRNQENGEVSVQVVRDYNEPDANGFGKLIGVAPENLYDLGEEADALRQSMAPYVPHGLSLDASDNTMWYMGKQVRELFDSVAGVLVTSNLGVNYPKDAIDVMPVYENGALTGLRAATRAEYDQRTQERREWRQDSIAGGTGDEDQAFSGIEWWTEDEYEAWLEQERIGLEQVIGGRAWNDEDGWFIWTREKVDETIRMYEQILEDIKGGVKVSKPIASSGDMIMIEGIASYAMTQSVSQGIAIASVQENAVATSASTDVVFAANQNAAAEITTVSSGFSAVIRLSGGTAVDLGAFDTYVERYNAVKAFCEQQVAEGKMTQAEAEIIIRQYM